MAIGNGTACRETEELVAEIIAEGVQFSQGGGGAAGRRDRICSSRARAGRFAGTIATPARAARPGGSRSPRRTSRSRPDTRGGRPGPGEPRDRRSHGKAPADQSHSPGAHDGDAAAASFSESSHTDASISSFGAEHDGASVAASHAASDHHSSGPAEPAFELPPLSGGSPDSTSSETDVEMSAGSSRPEDGGSTALLAGNHQTDHAGTAHAAAEPESTTAGLQPGADAPAGASDPERADSHEGAAAPDHTRNHEPAATESPADSSAPPEHAGADLAAVAVENVQPAGEPVPAPAAEGETPAASTPGPDAGHEPGVVAAKAAPEGKEGGGPKRSGRHSGRGRSDSSRSRGGPRIKPGPPPPETPPKPHPADVLLAQLAYVVVNEAGASVYSTSQIGREEFPDSDATLRSGVSIGRRLQDPLAELVKIEPQNIGVGLYQHDVNPKHLKETLESVISSCVNFVGVDLNTASVALLRHVSGLNQLTARRIVDYRKEHGPFPLREKLLQVDGIGPASYTQAAGFLKITDGEQPLDRTWIHPESYALVTGLLEKLGFSVDVVRDQARLPELRGRLAEADFVALVSRPGSW